MYTTHQMRMVRIEDSGLEEWACPTCGRRMLLRWPPDYEKRVIEPGDEKACHICSDTDDTPPDPPQAPTGEATGETPGTGCGAGRRWLRETGAHTARPHVIPP